MEPQSIKLSLLDDNDAVIETSVDVLAPYEVFHYMYHGGDFAKTFLSDEISLYSYWETLMSQPWASAHPLFGRPHLWSCTVPLNYFTDGADFSKSSSAEGLEWHCFQHEWAKIISCRRSAIRLVASRIPNAFQSIRSYTFGWTDRKHKNQ